MDARCKHYVSETTETNNVYQEYNMCSEAPIPYCGDVDITKHAKKKEVSWIWDIKKYIVETRHKCLSWTPGMNIVYQYYKMNSRY